MSSRWENIVRSAREIDQSFASGRQPEFAYVAGLARAVLDFQQHLVGTRQAPLKPPSVRRTEPPLARGDRESSAA
ncbi:MAG TPA: hypothetical protein VF765_38400 [Polyangiaceae bacterium]